jgi:hypothetical protein
VTRALTVLLFWLTLTACERVVVVEKPPTRDVRSCVELDLTARAPKKTLRRYRSENGRLIQLEALPHGFAVTSPPGTSMATAELSEPIHPFVTTAGWYEVFNSEDHNAVCQLPPEKQGSDAGRAGQ